MNAEHLTQRSACTFTGEENEMSRRALRVLENWASFGATLFAEWPDRPRCGHFLGGAHWYGLETMSLSLAFASMAVAGDLDEDRTGVTRRQAVEMAVKGLRYLCFTHDAGPEDCIRPSVGLGRPENLATKWGERGRGFFPESQCGWTIAGLVTIASLLAGHLDDETWGILGVVCEDYLERFGYMEPRSGVYDDTQTEENAWTAVGIAASALVLDRHPNLDQWLANSAQWMFSSAVTPQDAKNHGLMPDGRTVREWTQRKFTMLPDYFAENHGMVHPTYTASSVLSINHMACLFPLFRREMPREVLFNRERVYTELKRMADQYGALHPAQGMDWPYHFPGHSIQIHVAAALMLNDPDAARLERAAFDVLEARQKKYGGRMIDPVVADAVSNIQDPMVMSETSIVNTAYSYVLHRLYGNGPEPTEDDRHLHGAKVYPHSGIAHSVHAHGQTSVSWRNRIMALATNSDGIYTVAPAMDSILAKVSVKDQPESQHLRSIRIDEYPDAFAAAIIADRSQRSVRQDVLFTALSDGRTAVFERLKATTDIVVEECAQGLIRVVNDNYGLANGCCRGERLLHTADGSETYKGFVSTDPESDIVSELANSAENTNWLNVDDRLGVVYSGTGTTSYTNRHWFETWWATADDLVLNTTPRNTGFNTGDEITRLTALICPGQQHTYTSDESIQASHCGDAVALLVGATTYGVAAFTLANFGDTPIDAAFMFDLEQVQSIPVFEGTVDISPEGVTYRYKLNPGDVRLLQPTASVTVQGHVTISSVNENVFATNVGYDTAFVELDDGASIESDGNTTRIAAGNVSQIK
jgi:hypothetical protein